MDMEDFSKLVLEYTERDQHDLELSRVARAYDGVNFLWSVTYAVHGDF